MEFECQSIPNRLLKNCLMVNHREDIFEFLGDHLIIAEIGVLAGDFSELLLKKSDQLFLIDQYNATDWPSTHRFNSETHWSYVENRFHNNPRIQLLKGTSYLILGHFNDEYFDVIYIDGDHSYEIVKKDLFTAYKKSKYGGLIWLNDYTTYDPFCKVPYGVQRAVNELINIYDTEVVYYALNNSNFHDICLRKKPYTINNNVDGNQLSLYSTKYGHFFSYKNEEFIGAVMKTGEHWEDDLLQKVLPYIDQTDIVIDVGAHIGTHTIPYALKALKVYSFEPQSKIYNILSRNIQINHIKNVELLNNAVGHLDNVWVSIGDHVPDGDSQNETLSYESTKSVNYGGIQLGIGQERVKMRTLDSLSYPGRVKYIKVDVEGCEPLVFYGAQRLIAKDKPIILYEKRADKPVTQEMKEIMVVPDEVEHFCIESYCVTKLGYHSPVVVDTNNYLLIPSRYPVKT
jgi:FkbM family methyltransferase